MKRFGKGKKRRHVKQSPPLKVQRDRKVVAIATPMMDHCHAAYTTSLVHLVAHTMASPDHDMSVTFLQVGTSILPLSRQFLAVRALECEATHVLWIDSDMEFPRDMLLRLARHDHPLVAANCISRRPPFLCTARDDKNEQVATTQYSQGIEKVARFGFGVVWMSTEVLRKVPPPWFDLEWLPETGVFRGEDFVFCEKARAAGYELYIDHDVSKDVKHVGQFAYSPLLKKTHAEGES